MESRYDFTKSEQDWLSHALALSSAETRGQVKEIQAVDLTPSENVRNGSIVVIESEDRGTVERYFILPEGTSQEVIVVTPNSPVGVALVRKTKGNRCEVKTPKRVRYLIILSIE